MRQFGQRYSFVKEVLLEELEERHFAWDTDGTLDDALTLSRLVRDNGFSTQYAVRLLDYEDGQRCVVYVHREDNQSGGCTATASGWSAAAISQRNRSLSSSTGISRTPPPQDQKEVAELKSA
ncbi:MAG: hypothetical protein U0R52_06030 [Solirubrobacterales bacterium]